MDRTKVLEQNLNLRNHKFARNVMDFVNPQSIDLISRAPARPRARARADAPDSERVWIAMRASRGASRHVGAPARSTSRIHPTAPRRVEGRAWLGLGPAWHPTC